MGPPAVWPGVTPGWVGASPVTVSDPVPRPRVALGGARMGPPAPSGGVAESPFDVPVGEAQRAPAAKKRPGAAAGSAGQSASREKQSPFDVLAPEAPIEHFRVKQNLKIVVEVYPVVETLLRRC